MKLAPNLITVLKRFIEHSERFNYETCSTARYHYDTCTTALNLAKMILKNDPSTEETIKDVVAKFTREYSKFIREYPNGFNIFCSDPKFRDRRYLLGICYQYGIGTQANFEEAFRMFEDLNDKSKRYDAHEYFPVRYSLALIYCGNDRYLQDDDENERIQVIDWVAKKGCGAAQLKMGDLLKPNEAAKFYQLAADQGTFSAQSALGDCYQFGRGVAKDHKRAVELYKLGIKERDARSFFGLGSCYLNGKGVEQDLKQAAELFKQGAELGNHSSLYALALCYHHGYGVIEDCNRALFLAQQASLKTESAHAKQVKKLTAEIIQKNKKEKNLESRGIEYFHNALKQGDLTAASTLGFCYELGLGTKRDLKQACEFYKLALNTRFANSREAFLSFCNQYMQKEGLITEEISTLYESLKKLEPSAPDNDLYPEIESLSSYNTLLQFQKANGSKPDRPLPLNPQYFSNDNVTPISSSSNNNSLSTSNTHDADAPTNRTEGAALK